MLRQSLGFVLALALITLVVAHGVIVIALLRRKEWKRAALALLVPPLAPVAALDWGMRRPALVWVGAFVLYVVVLAFS